MTITATKLTDNSFNIIVKANGVGSEDEQILVDVVNSNQATSEPKVSIADIHYEILGTGKCTIFFKNDIEKKVEIEGRGNYGLKPTEERIKDAARRMGVSFDDFDGFIKHNEIDIEGGSVMDLYNISSMCSLSLESQQAILESSTVDQIYQLIESEL